MDEENKKRKPVDESAEQSHIKIMNKEDVRREFHRRLKYLGQTLALIFISVILSLIFFRLLYGSEPAPQKTAGINNSEEGYPGLYSGSAEDLKKLYEDKFSLALGIAVRPDDFKYNNADKVTNGMIIDNEGNILMPSTIITEGTEKVYIRVSNEAPDRVHEGRVLGHDPVTRITLLNCPTLKKKNPVFTGYDDLALGQTLLIFASPFGDNHAANLRLSSVFSKNLQYTLMDEQGAESKVSAILATSMVINSNDGGMVIDGQGKILGMTSKYLSEKLKLGNNTAVLSKIEIEKIRDRIIKRETSSTLDLGVEGKLIRYKHDGVEKPVFYVRSVEDKSTADIGGVLPLDMILSIDGQPVSDGFDINKVLKGKKVGETVTLEILRTGEVKKIVMKIY